MVTALAALDDEAVDVGPDLVDDRMKHQPASVCLAPLPECHCHHEDFDRQLGEHREQLAPALVTLIDEVKASLPGSKQSRPADRSPPDGRRLAVPLANPAR